MLTKRAAVVTDCNRYGSCHMRALLNARCRQKSYGVRKAMLLHARFLVQFHLNYVIFTYPERWTYANIFNHEIRLDH